MKTHPYEIKDLISYMVNDQTPLEREQTEIHIAHCHICANELMQLEQTMNLLPLGMSPEQPPDTLRKKIFTSSYTMRPPMSFPDPSSRDLGTVPRKKTKQPFNRWLIWSSIAVVLMAMAGMGQQLVYDHSQIATLQSQLAMSMKTVTLVSTSSQRKATGNAVLVRQGNAIHLIIYLANMRPTMGSEVYHIWLLHDGKRNSAGTMTVRSDGTGVFEQTLSQSMNKFNAIGITLEPNPLTKVPEGPKVLGTNNL